MWSIFTIFSTASQPGAWVVGLAYRASIQGSQRQCAGSIRYVHTLTGWVGTGTGKLYCQVCYLGQVGYLGHEILPQVGYLGLVINLGQV